MKGSLVPAKPDPGVVGYAIPRIARSRYAQPGSLAWEVVCVACAAKGYVDAETYSPLPDGRQIDPVYACSTDDPEEATDCDVCGEEIVALDADDGEPDWDAAAEDQRMNARSDWVVV